MRAPEMRDPPPNQPQLSVCPVPLSGPGDASKPQSQAQAFVPPLLFLGDCFAWSFVLLVPTYSSRIHREHYYPSVYQ